MTKRKEFSHATKRKARERAGELCERCGDRAVFGECNHLLAAWLGGGRELGNAEHLCRACHREQTRKDIKAFAKVRRIRGETRSQWMGTNRHQGRLSWKKMKSQSKNNSLIGRSFAKTAANTQPTGRQACAPDARLIVNTSGPKRKIPSRGFRKDIRRKVSGEVVRV